MAMLRHPLALVLAIGGAALGCKGTASPSTAFGVNITVDAKALSADKLSKVSVGSLQVTGAETNVRQFSIAGAITSGELRFRFIPTAQTGMLKFHFDVLDSSGDLFGSGDSAQVTLAATAVSATITLTASPGTQLGDGTKCTAPSQCQSGFCTDGFCCNELCGDTCVSCALANSTGLCTPYDQGTDPEAECGGNIAGGADAGSSGRDGGPSDGSVTINAPDGGIIETPNACGGSCSGARSCAAFTDAGVSCGQAFCNTRKDVAALECDGKGSCAVSLSACDMYACADTTAACRTSCNANVDCQAGFYCNGMTNACASQKVDGISCLTDAECNSGHCSLIGTTGAGVCCNTVCDSPNTCNNSGSEGKCSCPGVTCAAGVACQIFYQDADHDGFGNSTGTIAAGTAMAGCAGTPPGPMGTFVADNTDCDDGDAQVNPKQAGYFGVASKGTKTFDYNCDGTIQKQLAEYPGATCKYCPTPSVGCTAASSSTCSTANVQASLACTSEISLTVLPPLTSEAPAVPAGTEALTIQPLPTCCGCDDHEGFTKAVDCGASAAYYKCGICMGVATTNSQMQQLCH
jgi:hypothetical protein